MMYLVYYNGLFKCKLTDKQFRRRWTPYQCHLLLNSGDLLTPRISEDEAINGFYVIEDKDDDPLNTGEGAQNDITGYASEDTDFDGALGMEDPRAQDRRDLEEFDKLNS